MSLVRLQMCNRSGVWENVKITNIKMSNEETLVLGKPWRILVDDVEIYRTGKKFMSDLKTRVEQLEKTLDQLLLALEDSQLHLKLNQKVVEASAE